MLKTIRAAALILIAVAPCSTIAAHEMTPTYPKFNPSFVDNVLVTKMKIWNRRRDVTYYEVAVFDMMWKGVPFATSEKIMKVEHLQQKTFNLYLKEKDIDRVEYICTISKQLKSEVKFTAVRSMICSRIKRDG